MCKECEKKEFVNSIKKVAKIQYINKGVYREPDGVMVAFPLPNTNKVVIGYSLCNYDAGDEFDKNKGIEIAANRAIAWGIKNRKKKIANVDREELKDFILRMKKYYKDKVFPDWVENFLLNDIDYRWV